MTKVAVEMVSDLVCPWCWVGLRRLKSALDMVPEIETELVFRPYQLDPTVPEGGMEYKAYMRAKFGSDPSEAKDASKSRWGQMREMLETYGREEDIPFDFDGMAVRPNTVNAHRIVHWAQGQGKGLAAKEALFTAYFRDHKDIGDVVVLKEIAESIGLDGGLVADLLAGDADKAHVNQEYAFFQNMGVRGVPFFMGNRRVAVQGAETAENIAQMIRVAAEKSEEAAVH